MTIIEGLTINESKYKLKDGTYGKIAVFLFSGEADPRKILDNAVSDYIGDDIKRGYYELIDSDLDNPWMRVVMSNINKMKQKVFEPNKDKLYKSKIK